MAADGGRWCSDAVVGRSAAASELFFLIFFKIFLYQKFPLLLLFTNPPLVFKGKQPNSLDLHFKFENFDTEKGNQQDLIPLLLTNGSALLLLFTTSRSRNGFG